MEWYHADPKVGSGMMMINGSGLFTGDADIQLGQIFAQNMVNEGFRVTCGYGEYDGESALEVRFTTDPNAVFFQ